MNQRSQTLDAASRTAAARSTAALSAAAIVHQPWWIVAAKVSMQSPRIVTPARQVNPDIVTDVHQQLIIV
jgi:hypothetical protein